jgi:hypothetical protein
VHADMKTSGMSADYRCEGKEEVFIFQDKPGLLSPLSKRPTRRNHITFTVFPISSDTQQACLLRRNQQQKLRGLVPMLSN